MSVHKKAFVRMLTIKENPIGVITRSYLLNPRAGSLDADFYVFLHWVRLSDGVLLKDVSENEFERVLPERKSKV